MVWSLSIPYHCEFLGSHQIARNAEKERKAMIIYTTYARILCCTTYAANAMSCHAMLSCAMLHTCTLYMYAMLPTLLVCYATCYVIAMLCYA